MSKPTIVLVPGSFGLPEFYNQILDPISSAGYDIKGLHMPTVGESTLKGRDGVPPTMYDDAAFIAERVEKLADEDKDIVLVAHSYGGVPVTQSTKGLSKKERESSGKKGGIVRIAYMTCLTPALGKSAADILAGVPEEHKVNTPVDDNGWAYQDNPARMATIIAQNISSSEAESIVKKMPKHSAISFVNPLTHAGYKDIPVSYLWCEEDRCIPAIIQKEGIDMMESESESKVDVTAIKADHCPNATATQAVIDWILSVAKKV